MRVLVGSVAALAVMCAGVACSDDDAGDIPEGQPMPTVAAEDANFVLTVSNQSFDEPLVFVTVEIDGQQVIAQDFDVGAQHNFVPFNFALQPGAHELTAGAGHVEQVGSFTVPANAPHYAVLFYWTDPAPLLSLDFTAERPGFA